MAKKTAYQQKLDQAQAIIEAQNAEILVGEDDRIDFDSFVKCLRKKGGKTVKALALCSWNLLQECGLPELVAQGVADAFREKPKPSKQKADAPVAPAGPGFILPTSMLAPDMSDEELLRLYDPLKSTQPVAVELRKRAGDRPFIVFNPESSKHDEKASLELLKEIVEGEAPRKTFKVDGRPQPVFRIGERPDQSRIVNPLYPAQVLRADGECDNTGLNWSQVAEDSPHLLQLVFLAVDSTLGTGEVKVRDVDHAHQTFELITGEDGENKFRSRYQTTSLRFDELQQTDSLPPMKKLLPRASVMAAQRVHQGGNNDPFRPGQGDTHARH